MISNTLYSDSMVVTDDELIGKKKIVLGKFVRKCIFAFISQLFFGRAGHSLDFFRPGRAIPWDFFHPGRAISKLFVFGRAGLPAAAGRRAGPFLGFFSHVRVGPRPMSRR